MEVRPNATGITTYHLISDSTSGQPEVGVYGTNLVLTYTRTRSEPISAQGTNLSTNASSHTDYGVIEVHGTNSPGLYRVDWPDAAFASGSPQVQLTVFKGAGGVGTNGFHPSIIEVEINTKLGTDDKILLSQNTHVLHLSKLVISSTNSGGALDISNSVGRGINVSSSGSDGAYIESTSGSGYGLYLLGAEDFEGLYVEGGQNATGASIVAGSGNPGNPNPGLWLVGGGGSGATGSGLRCQGGNGNAGHGALFQGGTLGSGISSTGGSGAGAAFSSTSGAGISFTGGTNRPGADFIGAGSGSGILATGGGTGHGADFLGGSSSGHGIRTRGQTSGQGLRAEGVGTGSAGIRASGASSDGIQAIGSGTTGAGIKGSGVFAGIWGTGQQTNSVAILGWNDQIGANAPGIEGRGAGTGDDIKGVIADLDTRGYTSARATNLDFLDAAVSLVPTNCLEVGADTYTLRELHRGYASVLLGKSTNDVFRSITDTTNRVTATTSPLGNRQVITLNLSTDA